MGALKNQILEALDFLPETRQRNSRQRNLHLDDLLDAAPRPPSGGARDFIYTAYRYLHAYHHQSKDFFRKKVKSAPFQDLALLAYSSLLSRDKIPGQVLGSELIEAAKGKVAAPLISPLNAFCRWVTSHKEELLQELQKSPEILVGPALAEAWKAHPALVRQAGARLLVRPEGGIWSFDRKLDYRLRSAQEFLESPEPLMAMNPGSQLWVKFLEDKLPAAGKEVRFLDACAAPGAKFIWETLSLQARGSRVHAQAIEEKFPRMERLKGNLKKFSLSEARCELLSVGTDPFPPEISKQSWDLVTADLPCSGSGTFFSRPDLLANDSLERLDELIPLQRRILEALRALKPRTLAVSVCSVDPREIEEISKTLGAQPLFSSWKDSAEATTDGMTGWLVTAN